MPTIEKNLNLQVGDWVMVRSPEEILSTLDSNARLEELPFMPQMLGYCGKKFQVRKRAHKLCDTVHGTGGRELNDAVFLDDLRCGGESYGGCELRCAIIFKESWLRRTEPDAPEQVNAVPPRLSALLEAGTHREDDRPDDRRYVCQGTQLPAATKLLPWWKPGQYVEDYRSGNVPLRLIVSRLAFLFYSELVSTGLGFGSALRWAYDAVQKVVGGEPYPVRPGSLPIGGSTPTVDLGLKVGDLVRVKSGDEILATVDELLVNRGMAFHPEMMTHCGKTFRISQRLEKLINEKTGQLRILKNSCIVLDGAGCDGTCTRPLNCPRACPPYWREIWLEPVKDKAEQVAKADESRTLEVA